MCDTVVYRGPQGTWLAKNSDREPDEYQCIEAHPHSATTPEEQRTTYIKVAVPSPRHSVVIGRPYWMWGAEMGANDHGVAIGNEAVFTRLVDRNTKALLGMDLVRLALEYSVDAESALDTITHYLEIYGQGGPAGYHDKRFSYDNSFLIADASSAWILETAGRFWVAKQVETYGAISNELTITNDYDRSSPSLPDKARGLGFWSGKGDFDFRRAFRRRFMPWVARSARRRECNLLGLAALDRETLNEEDFFALLRRHRRERPASNADVCMHAGRLTRRSATTAAMVTHLQDKQRPRVYMCQGQPCENPFNEVRFAESARAQ